MSDATIIPVPETFAPAPPAVVLTATLHQAWDVPAPVTEGVIVESSTSGHFDAAARNDYGNHKFVSDREMQGASNESWANLWRYVGGAPAADRYWKVLPPPDSEGYGYKLDFVAPCPNGTGVYELWGTAHQIKSGPRKTCIWFAPVLDAGWVSGPHSQLEADGGPFDNSGLEGTAPDPTPGEPVDYARIQAMLDTKFALLVQAFGGASVRGGIQEKVEDGVVGVFDPHNADPRAVAFRAALPAAMLSVLNNDAYFAQSRNTTSQFVAKVLIELGVADPTQAPEWVKGLPGFPWPHHADQTTVGPAGEHTNAQEVEGK